MELVCTQYTLLFSALSSLRVKHTRRGISASLASDIQRSETPSLSAKLNCRVRSEHDTATDDLEAPTALALKCDEGRWRLSLLTVNTPDTCSFRFGPHIPRLHACSRFNCLV